MSVNRGLICYFIGVAAGSGATYILLKNYYKHIADEEIASVKEVAMRRASKLYSEKAEEAIKNFEKEDVEFEEDDDRELKNYTSCYTGGGEAEQVLSSLAEQEYPKDDEPVTKKTKKKSKKAPKIIKSDDYDADPQYRKMTLYYYVDDEVLADEAEDTEYEDMEGKKLGKYSDLVGNCISKYGFDVNDETVIFVRNEEIGVDFEIQKDFGAFADLKEEDY